MSFHLLPFGYDLCIDEALGSSFLQKGRLIAVIFSTQESGRVRGVIGEIQDWFNNGNIDNLIDIYAEDAILLPPGPDNMEGKEGW